MFQLHYYTLPYTKTKEKQKVPEIKNKKNKNKLTTTYTSRSSAQKKKKKLKLNNSQQNKFLAPSQLGEVRRQFEMKVAKDGYDHLDVPLNVRVSMFSRQGFSNYWHIILTD